MPPDQAVVTQWVRKLGVVGDCGEVRRVELEVASPAGDDVARQTRGEAGGGAWKIESGGDDGWRLKTRARLGFQRYARGDGGGCR